MDDTSALVIDARTAAAITKYSCHCHIRCAAAFGWELGGRKCGWKGDWDQRRMQTMHSRARVRGMLHGCMPACMLLSLTASSKHVHFNLHTYSMHAHARPATAKVRGVFTHPSCPCLSVQSKPGGGAHALH